MVIQTVKLLQLKAFTFKKPHPLVKGVLAYALMWPTGSLIQQTLEGRNLKTYDWARMLRFSIFGGLYVAPTLYGWVRLTSAMWPQTNLRFGIIKAVTEQLSYGPFSCASFFIGMSLLEQKSMSEAIDEVKEKFAPTYKVGICVWPILQTINFSMVPEHNRLVFVSLCSLVWTCFLAYMKTKHIALDDVIEQEAKQS